MLSLQSFVGGNVYFPELKNAGDLGFSVALQVKETGIDAVAVPFEYRYKRADAADFSQWFTVDTILPADHSVIYRQAVLKSDIVPACDPCSGTYYFDFREIDETGQPVATLGTLRTVTTTGIDWEGF